MTDRTTWVRADDPPASESWVLTPFDRANLWLVLRGTWVFDHVLDATALQEGLAGLLACYPHLAGRMHGGKVIECSNAGVPFTTAERPDLHVAEVCERQDLAGELANPLHKGRVKTGREAPMTVRLTRLADGSVLSVRCTHACLDGSAFYSFVRNWARVCAGRAFPPPLLDQSRMPVPPKRPRAEVIRDAKAAGWTRISILRLLAAIPNLLGGRLLERTAPLPFSEATLARIRQTLRDASGCPDISTQEALGAHLVRLATRIHGLPNGTPCTQVVVMDMRERFARFPREFVGNAPFVVRGAVFRAGASLGEVAADAHRRTAPFLARPSAALANAMALTLETTQHRLLLLPYDATAMHQRRPTLLYLNNFVKLPVYDVDFGGGGPVRVIPHDLPDPWLVWPAPPKQGGVEVYLTGVAARAAARQRPGWWGFEG